MGDKLKSKLFLVFKMVIWLQVFIISAAICIPSMIVALQYSDDGCVKSLDINVELDLWLLISSILQLTVVFSFLPTVCCLWRHWCSKAIPFLLVFILLSWGCFGIYIIVKSDLSKCDHESLWVMALIDLVFVFGHVVVYFGSQIYGIKCCGAKCCGNSSELGESDNENRELFQDFIISSKQYTRTVPSRPKTSDEAEVDRLV